MLYNGWNSFIFVNGDEIYKSRAKDLVIQKRLCYIDMFIMFSIDYDKNNVDGTLDINKYLIVKNKTEWCSGLLLKCLLHY